MTSRPKDPKTARNKNILVIGGSGSGKTRFFVKPSLLQMHSSYVVTDPKGQLLRETGKLLAHGGPKRDENGKPVRDGRGKVIYEPYRIKVLNTINFSKSMKYNPLAYVRSEKDILLWLRRRNCGYRICLDPPPRHRQGNEPGPPPDPSLSAWGGHAGAGP